MDIKKILILTVVLLVVTAKRRNSEYDSPDVKVDPTPFSHWSWVWAIGCILALLAIRTWIKNKAIDHAKINVMDELKKRDGVYRREDYEADKNGVLQTLPKDQDDLIKLPLSKRTKINHDTYHLR